MPFTEAAGEEAFFINFFMAKFLNTDNVNVFFLFHISHSWPKMRKHILFLQKLYNLFDKSEIWVEVVAFFGDVLFLFTDRADSYVESGHGKH